MPTRPVNLSPRRRQREAACFYQTFKTRQLFFFDNHNPASKRGSVCVKCDKEPGGAITGFYETQQGFLFFVFLE
jgi:hypothetical protein